jgi:hypothetical protein
MTTKVISGGFGCLVKSDRFSETQKRNQSLRMGNEYGMVMAVTYFTVAQ